jgi:hypothetical protein
MRPDDITRYINYDFRKSRLRRRSADRRKRSADQSDVTVV